jgi:hypothetical protein
VVGDEDHIESRLEEDAQLKALVQVGQSSITQALGKPIEKVISHRTSIITDDWPFLYLNEPSIPPFQIIFVGILCVLFMFTLFRDQENFKSHLQMIKKRQTWHFAALGAAFLLYQLYGMNRACLALGNTWIVNSVIISMSLTFSLFGTLLVRRFATNKLWLYVALVTSLCFYASMHLSHFANFGFLVRAILVGAMTTFPILLSSAIFAHSLKSSDSRRDALTANLYGALIGGLLQCLMFLYGLQSLAIGTFMLYLLAFFCDRWGSRKSPDALVVH